MTIRTELCRVRTHDRETLHGLLFAPERPQGVGELALLLVHGVAMNFYTGPLPVVGQALAEQGYPALSINTRGHDWISRAGDLTAFGGATYENFEDCLPDLDAALGWLAGRGYRRFVLVGHSLGAVKVLFYQGNRARPDVVGIISCSAPRQFYSARAIEQPEFTTRMEEAEALVEAGQGEAFIWAQSGGAPGMFSARTYVSKYGRHERNDVRPHAARLGCPLLAIAGGAEHPFYPMHARELAEAAGAAQGSYHIVEGSGHFYWRYEAAVIQTLAGWLERLRT